MSLEHRQKIQRAIEHIRAHIGHETSPLTAAEVAKTAHMSEYHFQRIFKLYMKETLGQYITRKRLESAAVSLLYGQRTSITDLAFRSGYASTASFSKAFVQWFGCRPSEIGTKQLNQLQRPGRLQRSLDKHLANGELRTEQTSTTRAWDFASLNERIEIRTIDEFSVYGLTSAGGYQLSAVEETWCAFREQLEDLGLDWTSRNRFAICHDHPGLMPKERCRYDACIKIDDAVPDGLPFFRTTIPAGRYAIFPCEGTPEEILPQYIAFYSLWLPQSPYVPDNFPVVDHCLGIDTDGPSIELWAKIKRSP